MSARDIIIREVVSNLLIHREYQSPYPAKLVIDADGLHTENASRSLFEGRITLADFTPMPKNPVIAGFFSHIGRADRLGSGFHNLVKYARVYANAEPELTEGDVFRAFIPIRDQTHAQASASLTTSDKGSAKNVGDAIELLLNSLGYATPPKLSEWRKCLLRQRSAILQQWWNGTLLWRKEQRAIASAGALESREQ